MGLNLGGEGGEGELAATSRRSTIFFLAPEERGGRGGSLRKVARVAAFEVILECGQWGEKSDRAYF